MDQEKQEIRVANIFSEAITKILRHSLNDDFRSTCFDAFRVSNSQDFLKACEAETLRNIRPKSMPGDLHPTNKDVGPTSSQTAAVTQLTAIKHAPSSLPKYEDQSEIEVIELDSSDDECSPDDYQESNCVLSSQTAPASQQSLPSSLASQQSNHSTIISQQSTPPCLSQLFDF